MNSFPQKIFACWFLFACVWTACSKASPAAETKAAPPSPAALVFRELRYDGKVTDDEARFVVNVTAESLSKAEVSEILFQGELGLLPPKLPTGLRIERAGDVYRLIASKPGQYQFKLELVAKITRGEPWNQVSFKGPAAAIASVAAQATGADVDLQLLSGTLLQLTQTNGVARLSGFLSADQTVALRWSRAGGAAEVARKAVATADTLATAQITPTVIKYVTQVRYDIIQGKVPKLTLALPASHALTRLVGDQIRDWEIKTSLVAGSSATGAVQIV